MPESAVLITGAAKRVGRALALHLAKEGYDIGLHYHRSHDEAEQTAQEIERLGRKCALLRADLGDLQALPSLIRQAQSALPHCRGLINNASLFTPKPFMEAMPEDYEAMFRINFAAPAFLTQAFAEAYPSGHVVHMLDTKVMKNKHSYFYYLLAKKSLRDFTKMAAVELAPNIRVNAVCPGILLPSELGHDEEYMRKRAESLPLKQIAGVPEVCDTVAWLLRSGGITGQCIFVDGGEHLL